MICQTPVHQVCNYGVDSQYLQPPSTEQILNGVIPLDSLPADWWNFLWNDTNRAVNEARTGFTQVLCELNTVLSCALITADQDCYNQLYQSIDKIRQTIGTSAVAGAVKSSGTNGQVSIANTGVMTVNGLGNVSNICYGTYTNMVTAVNCFRNWAETCFGNVSTCLTSLGNGKAPTNHASSATTYGIGTQANYGHIKLCSCTNSSCGESNGIAATPAAVKSAYDRGSTALTCAQSAYTLASGRSTVPTNHASSATTYGIGTQANYGHIKLCSCIDSLYGENSGVAATPAAITFLKAFTTKPGPVIPAAIGCATAGLSNTAARADHVHSLRFVEKALYEQEEYRCYGRYGMDQYCICHRYITCNTLDNAVLSVSTADSSARLPAVYYPALCTYTSKWTCTYCGSPVAYTRCYWYPGIVIG